MTVARKEIVNEDAVGVYSCVSRCVRRSYLCGKDYLTGKDFSHRKKWIESRIQLLSEAFYIDVISYAILSTHLHISFRNRPDIALNASDVEIAERWLKVYSGRYIQPVNYTVNEAKVESLAADEAKIKSIRQRLASPSWFMCAIKEPIARIANKEDDCKGAFWERRFSCTRIEDESALLANMVYIDLNPVRAGIATTPEKSEYTSAKCRCDARNARKVLTKQELSEHIRAATKHIAGSDRWLANVFREEGKSPGEELIPATLDQYLKLLDWTGRQIRCDKRGAIPSDLRPILERLEIDTDNWHETVNGFGNNFRHIAGKAERIKQAAKRAGRKYFRGIGAARQAFSGSVVPT